MFYRNIKNNKNYKLIDSLVINATNEAKDTLMVLYKDKDGKKYVRERDEFHRKFEKSHIQKFI